MYQLYDTGYTKLPVCSPFSIREVKTAVGAAVTHRQPDLHGMSQQRVRKRANQPLTPLLITLLSDHVIHTGRRLSSTTAPRILYHTALPWKRKGIISAAEYLLTYACILCTNTAVCAICCCTKHIICIMRSMLSDESDIKTQRGMNE